MPLNRLSTRAALLTFCEFLLFRFDIFAEDVSDRILTTVSPGMRAECKWIEDGKYYAGQFC